MPCTRRDAYHTPSGSLAFQEFLREPWLIQMNMSLSQEEEKVVRLLIPKLENRSRRWRWIRWVGIIISTVVLFSSILFGKNIQRMLGEAPTRLELSADNFNPQYVNSYIDYTISRERANRHFETAQAITSFGSLFFLIYFVADRNRGVRAGLLAKLLRQTFSKDTVA